METESRGDTRTGEVTWEIQAFSQMLKAMGPEVSQAVSKHQAQRRHSGTNVLFAIYTDKCQRDELTVPNEVSCITVHCKFILLFGATSHLLTFHSLDEQVEIRNTTRNTTRLLIIQPDQEPH